MEKGKNIDEERGEWMGYEDIIEWFDEEGRRVYGSIVN